MAIDPNQKPSAAKGSSLDLCRIVELPRIHDPRGSLTFIEGERHVPFDIRRPEDGAEHHRLTHRLSDCASV